MRQELIELRKLGENAYLFLHECNGHPGILFGKNVEAHITEMRRLWHTLDGTWDEVHRYSEDFLKKTFSEMRNKPIRTKGKIYPMKSGNSICDQMNRIVGLAGGYCYGNTNTHLKKALEISDRYGKNISSTKEYKDAFQKGYDSVMTDITKAGYSSQESEALTAGYGEAYAVKFPREVYAAT